MAFPSTRAGKKRGGDWIMHKGHLSALDAGFLYLETPEMPMHIGAMYLLKRPEGLSAEDYYDRYKQMIADRLQLAPLFTRKLANMPFDLANPVWIEDDDVDLDYHIRHTVMPKPGSLEQLEKLIGRLHSSLLDRSRPLWEFYIISGLENGDLAFYSKVHHAALDGQAGMKLTLALLDTTEEPRKVRPLQKHAARRGYQMGIGELLWSAATNALSQYVRLAGVAPQAVKSLADAYMAKDTEGKWGLSKFRKVLTFGPRTHFNVSITNQRSFASQSLPLAEVKSIGKALGATVNDMVMALCSGALRRYLTDYGDLPETPLVAAVPMSMRAEGDESQNNQVTMLPITLASTEKNVMKRLAAIKAASESMKDLGGKMKGLGPIDVPSIGAPWLMTGLVALYGRSNLADALPPVANVVISNVPGPNFPLYMTGAMLRGMYPVSIPAHGVGCNITVQSYNGALDFGITACRRAMPDVKALAGYLKDALAELKHAAAAAAADTPPAPEKGQAKAKAAPRKAKARGKDAATARLN
jgi:diacylglycerol O-acyltransferase / wax synthase